MAMPRYRYAIGQAPVRFPSPAPNKEASNEDRSSIIGDEPTRSNRSSLAAPFERNQRRNTDDTARLQDAHRKTKSMFNTGTDSSHLEEPSDLKTMSRRSSTLGVGGMQASRSSDSLTVKRHDAEEKTPLKSSGNQDMLQRQARPASTSISNSSGPSSLFWTAQEADALQAGNTNIAKRQQQRSYGAVESSASNLDDPYGYRQLAGPALLPSYHEEQQKQQRLKQVNSRTCGPKIEMLRARRSWAIAALGIVITVAGVLFIFL